MENRVHFPYSLGDDRFGPLVRESLEREGVDTRDLVERERTYTQFAFVASEGKSGRRTIFWRPPGASLSPSEIDTKRIASARILHTDGLHTEAGLPVSLDGGTSREGMLELAAMADYAIVSQKFAFRSGWREKADRGVREASRTGLQVGRRDSGKRGLRGALGGGTIEGEPYRVEPVDTTGCGDLFHAGFIYGILAGRSYAEALDFGAWAAAMGSTAVGGRSGIPNPASYPRMSQWRSAVDKKPERRTRE